MSPHAPIPPHPRALVWRAGDPTLQPEATPELDAPPVPAEVPAHETKQESPEPEAVSEGGAEEEPSPEPPSFSASRFPSPCPVLSYLSLSFPDAAPLRDRAGAGERLCYSGRLAPVGVARGAVAAELAAALAEVPDVGVTWAGPLDVDAMLPARGDGSMLEW